MAKVKVKVAWPGEFRLASGKRETITPERCRYIERTHAAMRKAGIRFPVPWGHQGKALPADPLLSNSMAFLSSQYNAGEVESLERDPADGGTVAVLDCPGVEQKDGKLLSVATLPGTSTPVTCAISEVSPALGCKYVDGKGRVWNDILAHVALTPFPIQPNQSGFTALSGDPPLGGFYLANRLPGSDDESDDDDDEYDSADPELTDDLLQPADDDDDGEMVPDDNAGDPNGPGSESAERLARVMGTLAKFRVVLPPDTTPENLLERLDSALIALDGIANQPGAQADPNDPNQQPPREDPTVAQNPAVMMSNLPPVAQKLIREEFKRRRKVRLDRIEAFVKRGLDPVTANELRAETTMVKLSIDADGEIKPAQIDDKLDLLEKTLPKDGDPRLLLSAALPVASPNDPAGGEEMVRHEASGLMMPKSQLNRIKEQAKR